MRVSLSFPSQNSKRCSTKLINLLGQLKLDSSIDTWIENISLSSRYVVVQLFVEEVRSHLAGVV